MDSRLITHNQKNQTENFTSLAEVTIAHLIQRKTARTAKARKTAEIVLIAVAFLTSG